MTEQKHDDACRASLSDAGLERRSMGLAEFIERCGGFELKPYQREIVAAIERGERLMIGPVTMREPRDVWKQRYYEYLLATELPNDQGNRLAEGESSGTK